MARRHVRRAAPYRPQRQSKVRVPHDGGAPQRATRLLRARQTPPHAGMETAVVALARVLERPLRVTKRRRCATPRYRGPRCSCPSSPPTPVRLPNDPAGSTGSGNGLRGPARRSGTEGWSWRGRVPSAQGGILVPRPQGPGPCRRCSSRALAWARRIGRARRCPGRPSFGIGGRNWAPPCGSHQCRVFAEKAVRQVHVRTGDHRPAHARRQP